jgi:hypothetical protein
MGRIKHTINSKKDLINLLKSFNVNIDSYNTGRFKSIKHLYTELKNNECVLSSENGVLYRNVNFVGAFIHHKNETLKESKQVFKDGRERIRSNMPYSMAEKFILGENTSDVLVRGLKEELDVSIDRSQFVYLKEVYVEENGDYPGIQSQHIGKIFKVNLNTNQYSKKGYIENQSDKKVYFNWK